MSDEQTQPEATTTTILEPTAAEPTAVEPEKPLLADEPAKPEPEPLTAESLKFPEGYEVDEAYTGEFLEIANEAKLSPEQANRLADLAFRSQQAASEALVTAWVNQQSEWFDQSAKHFGEGFEQALGKIKALNNEYGSSEFAEVMHLTGAEKHPAVLQFLEKIANKLVVEGKAVSGAPATTPKTLAERMYPNS